MTSRKSPTRDEYIATWIANQLEDGESVWAGTNLPVPRAGLTLAHFSHCPNLQVLLSFYQHNFASGGNLPASEMFADGRLRYGAERVVMRHQGEAFAHIRDIDVFFVGGLQVDQFGNTNLIGIGNEDDFKVRGAGPAGASSFSADSDRYYIYTTRHNPRVFVEECDFISTVGPRRREELSLPGGGPENIITPLGILGFTPDGYVRLEATLPGVSIENVQDATGFELEIANEVNEIQAPSDDELRLLRDRVDPEGYLRE